jgi:Tol biopolymer transport system component
MISTSIAVTGSCHEDDTKMADEQSVEINAIPASAKIIFHKDNSIYTMDENGENMTQITYDDSFTLEHVALSYDKTKIVCNYFSDLSVGSQSSKMILYDIIKKTRTHLLSEFETAGNGGVDWDKNDNIYFSGVAELLFSNPRTIPEFKANAGANDIYKMKYDGTGLQNLTNTTEYGEADVSLSPDNKSISYMATNIADPENSFTEIWKRDIDGTNPLLLFVGGKDKVSSVHDPEISPDGNYVVFSRVNNDVEPVFPDNPWANTAHDIIKLNLNTSELMIVTEPGPISIAPDWTNDKILFLDITDKTNPPHAGLATINSDGTDYKLIKNSTNIGKWIPE